MVAASNLAKALQSLEFQPLLNDKNDTSEALSKLAEIFMQRSEAMRNKHCSKELVTL